MSRQTRPEIGKKGIMAFNFLAMVPRIIFLVIMLIVCVILISMFLNNKFDTTDTQAEVLINGLLYGTGGLGYFDPVTGRIYPQILDLTQIHDEDLNLGFYYPENNIITAKIEFYLKDSTVPMKTYYYNKEWYENWEPLLKLKYVKGIGGVTDYTKELPIMYLDRNRELKSGRIKFQVVQPRSVKTKK